MITVRVVGGLGNQMFQYAAARALADRHDTGVYLDLAHLERFASTHREFGLDEFALDPSVSIGSRDGSVRSRIRDPIGALRRRSTQQVVEDSLPHPAALLGCPDRSYVIGYFQSDRYFAHLRADLLDELAFRRSPTAREVELADRIGAGHAVAVHVRRGDYVDIPHVRAVHGVVDRGYYRRAVEALDLSTDTTAFVFSDDPAWCREHLDLGIPSVIVEGAGLPHEDLRLMTRCDEHVIANSSFSWWGAWLAEGDGRVVAPARWFSHDDPLHDFRTPRSWLRV